MKIAMMGHKRIPSREGGIEIVVEELSCRLADMGNSVVVYNRKGHHVSGREFETASRLKEYKGVKLKTVFTFENGKLNAIVYSILAALRIAFCKYDVVHIHAEGPAVMCRLLKCFGKRVVVTIHGLDWQRSKWGGFATKFLKYGEKTAAKYADEIIVLSENVHKYFLETYGRETVYIPNGITRNEYKPCQEIRDKFSLEKNEYILYLGRIVPEKGIHYLIKAFKNTDTSKKLVIAGGASHTNEYMSEIKELAGDDDRIIFTDFVQGRVLEELYSNAYIYCLPSDLEGMPLSLLEAMSFGCCCLTSDIEECTEVCEDKGVYFKRGNVDDLQRKLSTLLADSYTVSTLKAGSADFICGKYNWDNITNRTLKLYGAVK